MRITISLYAPELNDSDYGPEGRKMRELMRSIGQLANGTPFGVVVDHNAQIQHTKWARELQAPY